MIQLTRRCIHGIQLFVLVARSVRRHRSAVTALMVVGLVGAVDAKASTTVSGKSGLPPLVISPAGDSHVIANVDLERGTRVFVVESMPKSIVARRISIGEFARAVECVESPSVDLDVYRLGARTGSPTSEPIGGSSQARPFAGELDTVTWLVRPVELEEGGAYAFAVRSPDPSCGMARSRSWVHNTPTVDGGDQPCDAIEGAPGRLRLWHSQDVADAGDCALTSSIEGFDLTMPSGWTQVDFNAAGDGSVATGSECATAAGAVARSWHSGIGICQFPQFSAIDSDAGEDGWYYGLPWVGQGLTGAPRDLYFRIEPDDPPTIQSQSASELGSTGATLTAAIQDGGSPTTFRVEWGTDAEYGRTTPADETLDASGIAVARLSGLAPRTTYHYRFVARHGTGDPVVGDDATFTTKSIPPINDVPPAISGTPRAGGAVSASVGRWSGIAPFTYTYQWQRCDANGTDCGEISHARKRSYEIGPGDIGTRLRVSVVASSAEASRSATSALAGTVKAALPFAEDPPVVSGLPALGEVLDTTLGSWNPLTPEPQVDVRWQRCDENGTNCTDVPDAVDSHYTVAVADVGHRMRAEISATAAGERASVASEPTRVVTAPKLFITAAPELTRIAGPGGDTYTADKGEWGGPDEPTSFGYHWQRCNPSGANCVYLPDSGATLAVRSEYGGSTVRAVVTAHGSAGSAVARSAASPLIDLAEPALSSLPEIRGEAFEGGVLGIEPGDWTGPGPLQLAYRWRRCDAAGTNCDDIPGARRSVYEPLVSDVGHTLRVVAIASNSAGAALAESSPSQVVLARSPGSTPPRLADGSAVTLSGEPRPGQQLTADKGAWIASGLVAYQYEWQRCTALDDACDTIADASGSSYLVSADDLDAFLRVVVTASNFEGDGYATVTTTESVHTLSSPRLNVRPSISGSPEEGQPLTATPGEWAVTGHAAYDYQWQTCSLDECEDVPGEAGVSFTPQAGDVGRSVRVVVTARVESGATTATSDPTVAVAAATPLLVASPTLSGAARQGIQLQASPGAWDGLQPIAHTYQWERCRPERVCAEIAGATASSLLLGPDDVGSHVRVLVRASNAIGEDAAVSPTTPAVVDADVPTLIAAPAVAGSSRVGQGLTATPGSWSGPGAIDFSYEWDTCDRDGEDCVTIEGETDSTLTLTMAEADTTIRARVAATNTVGTAEAVSGTTALVALPATETGDATTPRNHEAPAITGDPEQGVELAATHGMWSPEPELGFAYRWRRCDGTGRDCIDIDAATDAVYTPESNDVGSTITVAVTAANASGASIAVAEPTAAVVSPRVRNVARPTVSGLPADGEVLTADPGAWNLDDLSYEFQWESCESDGTSCSPVDGATGQAFFVDATLVGARTRVVVTASDGTSVGAAISDATSVVSTSAPHVDWPPWLLGQATAGAAEGATIEVAPGAWSGTPEITFAFRWQRCDADGLACVVIAGAESERYTPTVADVGSTLRALVTASNDAGSATEISDLSAIVVAATPPEVGWAPPAISFAPINPTAGPYDGQKLAAYLGVWTGGEPLTLASQWQRCDASGANCEDVPGATGENYTTVAADLGNTIRLRVGASNALGTSAAVSETTPIVAVAAPSRISTPWVSGTPHAGDALEVTAGTWAGSAPVEVTYRWRRCTDRINAATCAHIAGADSSRYELTDADVESYIRVAVTATNEHGSASLLTPSQLARPRRPDNIEPPSIHGVAVIGETLFATPGEWVGSYDWTTYQWRRCSLDGACEDIPGATDVSYLVLPEDANTLLNVAVTVHQNTTSFEKTAVSALTGVVASWFHGSEPQIEGSGRIGTMLRLDPGVWLGDVTLRWRWQQCDAEGENCHDLPGATQDGYVASPSDLGATLRAVVRATVSGDAQVLERVSGPSPVVRYPDPPANISVPLVVGVLQPGRVLRSDSGEWSEETTDYELTWSRCDGDGADCDEIGEDATYRVRHADVGARFRITVTGANAWGSLSVDSQLTSEVTPGEPLANVLPPTLDWTSVPEFGRPFHDTSAGVWRGVPDIIEQWQRCDPLTMDPDTHVMSCVDIPGTAGTSRPYTPTRADVGYRLRLKETASTADRSETLYTNYGARVAVNPLVKVRYSGVPVVGQTVTAHPMIDTVAGLPEDHEYLFVRAEFPQTVLQRGDDPTYTIRPSDIHSSIIVRVEATVWRADHGEIVAESSGGATTPRVDESPTALQLPSLSGEPVVGATLSVDPGVWDGGGGELAYSYQWEECQEPAGSCHDIVGATQDTYPLTASALGRSLRVRVTATNGPVQATASSGRSAAVRAAEQPANLELPVVTGQSQQGSVLSAQPGSWTGSEPLEMSYEWEACDPVDGTCEAVPSGDEAEFEPAGVHVGQHMRVSVTATNAGGSAIASSELTDAVSSAPAPVNIDLPKLYALGQPVPGSVLTTDGGTWEHVRRPELGYAWQRCSASGRDCRDVEGGLTPDYGITATDLGFRIRVEVSAATDSGETRSVSTMSEVITSSTVELERSIVLVNEGRDSLYVANDDGTGARAVASCDSTPAPPDLDESCELSLPTISPSGRMIAVQRSSYSRTAGETHRIVVMNANGSGARDVGEGGEPAWTSDPSELLISRSEGSSSNAAVHIYRLDLASDGEATATPVSNAQGAQRAPDVSPDGSSLVFAGTDPEHSSSGIYVADAHGNGAKRLDLGSEIRAAYEPAVSPDSNAIIFTATATATPAWRPPLRQLWSVNIDGSGLRRVTSSGHHDGPASYLGDRAAITMSRTGGLVCHLANEYACETPWEPSGPYRAWVVDPDGRNAHPLLSGGVPRGERDVSGYRRIASAADRADRVAERIIENQKLRDVADSARDASLALPREAGESVLRQATLGALRHVVSKASVVATVIEIGVFADWTSCEPAVFSRDAGRRFNEAGNVLRHVAAVRSGFHNGHWKDLKLAQGDLDRLRDQARSLYDQGGHRPCRPDYQVAIDVVGKLQVALKEGERQLARLHRSAADRAGRRILSRPQRTGTVDCDHAEQVPYPKGPDLRNYVVYWSPPPPPHTDVNYVGVSRVLHERCRQHRRTGYHQRADQLATLNLPPLRRLEARNVEEALIAHFGTFQEIPTNPALHPRTGQLINLRHEHNPNRREYCEYLLRGQAILRAAGYDPPTGRAYYTRRASCPGLGA